MERLKIYSAVLALATGLSACNNTASESNNESAETHESMSAAGDTITKHATGYSTAMHQMTNDMQQMTMSGNTDLDFAMMMKSHHQGAVDLSQFELTNGKDETLRKMALKISEEQKAEITLLETQIAQLAKVLKDYDPKDKQSGFARVMDESMRRMMDMSKMDTSMSADHQFVAMMIPHHQSAVTMAEGFLKYGKNEMLLGMAKKMILRQKKDINELNNWMDQHKE